jgi:hypothetical protein
MPHKSQGIGPASFDIPRLSESSDPSALGSKNRSWSPSSKNHSTTNTSQVPRLRVCLCLVPSRPDHSASVSTHSSAYSHHPRRACSRSYRSGTVWSPHSSFPAGSRPSHWRKNPCLDTQTSPCGPRPSRPVLALSTSAPFSHARPAQAAPSPPPSAHRGICTSYNDQTQNYRNEEDFVPSTHRHREKIRPRPSVNLCLCAEENISHLASRCETRV